MKRSMITLAMQFVAVLLLAVLSPAQGPSSWQSRTVPGGANPAGVSQHGKIIHYLSGGQLHVFSAFTRRWHALPVSASATVRKANDWLLVRDGRRFTAFSSMAGTFQPLNLSNAATVVNPTTQRNDSIALIRDGGTLYSFSGFAGEWGSLALPVSATVLVQRDVALIVDGNQIRAMSAFDGQWVSSTVATGVNLLRADGSIAVVETASLVHAFSARTARWTTAPALGPGASLATGKDVAVWSDGVQVLAFSGPRGQFSSQMTGRSTQLAADQQLAVATAGNSAWFFSAATARWTRFVTSGPWSLSTSAAVALLIEPNAVHAYSALTDSVATQSWTVTFSEVNWTVAAVIESVAQRVGLFSAYTGQWSQPPGMAMGAFPRTSLNGALIETTSGATAFSARSGSYISLATTGTPVLHSDRNSSILVVEESGQFHVFEPRREVWLSQQRAAQGQLGLFLWRTTLLVIENGWAYGYGSQSGRIESHALAEPPVDQGVSSESARVVTASAVIGYSPVPDLTTFAQFPEFRRMFSSGVPLHVTLRGPVRALSVIAFGVPGRASVPTPIGYFVLSPGLAVLATFPLGPIRTDGRAVVRLPVPDVAALHGLQIGFQGAVLPVSAPAYLTRLCGVYLH